MASNSFGSVFRITTWGESHGPAIGCVIDGCPSGIEISPQEIEQALARRASGRNQFVSERTESDTVEIVSGVFEGKTTGCPVSIIIKNTDADSSKYEPIKDLYRPGHANFTYLHKYGIFDYRGGGRSSARETVVRVAAGAIADKILQKEGIQVVAFLRSVGPIECITSGDEGLEEKVSRSLLFCPDSAIEAKMMQEILQAKADGDSLGGVVECVAFNVPIGLGDPVYDKIQARLAYGMMSLPAAKGFEIGHGFSASRLKGSEHNDGYYLQDDKTRLLSNHSGGVLAGITTGEPLYFRVAFKPTSSIKKEQKTVDLEGQERAFSLPEGSRHDPCVAVRAVPVVEAMCRLVLVDAFLSNNKSFN